MHYVSKDPIANLKVKVVVTRISALKRKPKYAEQVRSMGENGTQVCPTPCAWTPCEQLRVDWSAC